ncbi:carboxymuconolactone decarboxylase family protein [Subtercola sp. RTI3]|nr:carboxymuconolactone decarboxylase family protein [Subtercola sp. RTI3]
MLELDPVSAAEMPTGDLVSAEETLAALGSYVIDAIDAIGARRVHLAGLGAGGQIALWIAVHHADRVRRLAVVGAAAKVADPTTWQARADRVACGDQRSVADELAASWLTPDFRQRNGALVTELGAEIGALSADKFARLAALEAQTDLSPDLARVTAPTLFIAGRNDSEVRAAVLSDLSDLIPSSRASMIHGAGHLVTVEQPGLLLRALLEHFESAATMTAGYASRREALGDAHVDNTIASINAYTEPFQDFLTRYCWGEVWTRPNLGRRDRSLATIASLVTLGAEHEIGIHVRAGLRHGLTITEIQETLQHLALYAGLPRAFSAMQFVNRLLIDEGLVDPTPVKA